VLVVSLCFCFYSSIARADICETNPTLSSCGWDANLPDDVDEHTIGDDSQVSVPLDFGFPFYGNTYTHSWMHSNGVISFLGINSPTVGHMCCNGLDIDGGATTNYGSTLSHFIAPLWTDLRDYNRDIDGDGIDDDGFYTQGDSDSMKYFWRNVSEYGVQSNTNTFGVEIKDDGQIDMYQYDVNISNHSVFTGIVGDLSDDEYNQLSYHANSQGTLSKSNSYGNDAYTFNNNSLIYSNIPSIEAQCNANPLYNPACPGYADAYAAYLFLQQCNANPLYDSACNGYAEAYYNQQCSLDALYDTGCDGYEQKYYETYVEPYIDTGVEDETNTTTVTTDDNIFDDFATSDVVESITSYEVTGDAFVDQILRDTNEVEPVTIEVPDVMITEEFTEPTIEVEVDIQEEVVEEEMLIASIEEEGNNDGEIQSDSNVEESVDTDEGNEDGNNTQFGEEGDTSEDTQGGTESNEQTSEDDREQKESRKEKVKKLVKKRATQLADNMGKAASIEVQQQLQNQILALIGFNPDFTVYSGANITQPQFYTVTQMQDSNIPNNQRGLRNGLAQQLLHEKMVDMQYE
jgi:hypothetical protein